MRTPNNLKKLSHLSLFTEEELQKFFPNRPVSKGTKSRKKVTRKVKQDGLSWEKLVDLSLFPEEQLRELFPEVFRTKPHIEGTKNLEKAPKPFTRGDE